MFGERLNKFEGTVSSNCLKCLKWKEFIAEKSSIFVEKDLDEIHSQYFCHADDILRDDDCCVCSH